jgi:FixJ family two-component response regulator
MEAASTVVAIVDDDPAVRRSLHRLVLSLSHRPVSFASGEELLASLRQTLPNCIILDQHMPNMNGLEVLARMQVEGFHVPSIIITGSDQTGLREKCLAAGAVRYLVKPLDASTISSAIESASHK